MTKLQRNFQLDSKQRRATAADLLTTLPDSGCYSLIITLNRRKKIRVGKLGMAHFPAGTYIYTGSAMKGLAARLRRHCRRKKKLHWHIDHMLALPEARVKKIIVYPSAPGQECWQNRRIAAGPGAAIILRRFGASDCQSGCGSHLFFIHDARS
jgi:Uri superfamily endonuclease